ncbi:MAG: hypothetical protein JNK79_06390 [Chitinophagaceae bacterium]|nr:hypothetical protein [Chitinophagaceae bacterium]
MKPANLILFILAITLSSCNRTPSNQLWLYTNSQNAEAKMDEILSPVSFLWLAADGSYTRDFGKYEQGTWKKNDDTLLLLGRNGGSTSYIMIADKKVMRLYESESAFFTFQHKPLDETDVSANPFLPEYNLWRIKPEQRENDSLIIKRLINHCRFWEVYFNWGIENELATVDVRSLPTPLKIYSNGFTLKPVQRKWAKYFYDDNDALRSNEILEDVIRNNKFKWESVDHKYKMFKSVFQQLQEYLVNYSVRMVKHKKTARPRSLS